MVIRYDKAKASNVDDITTMIRFWHHKVCATNLWDSGLRLSVDLADDTIRIGAVFFDDKSFTNK